MSRERPFRSWAEDHVHDTRAMPPVDLHAFRIRATQRANTKRMQKGYASIRPATRGQAIRLRHEQAMSDYMGAVNARRVERETNPVEIARTHLQRRGLVIVRAEMLGGPAGRWDVSGKPAWLTDDELIALAVRLGFTPPTPKGNVDV